MNATIMDGKALSKKIREELKEKIQSMPVQPGLAVILVGDDPGSQVYVRNKMRACKQVGMYSETIRMPAESTQEEVVAQVERLNADPKIHGYIVQLPLPKHLNARDILRRIDPKKDADGMHEMNAGALISGAKALLPCTPNGCIAILKEYNIPMCGAEAVVIGRSQIVGKPVALMLLNENCTVTMCHSRTKNLADVVRRADIVVSAIGKPRFITGDMIKPGAAVIDVGTSRMEDGTLSGDVDFESAAEVASFITPVPGGVGPMTITMLLKNTVEACENAL